MPHPRETVFCKHPEPDKQGVNIDKWKYETISKTILGIVPSNKNGVSFKELNKLVMSRLDLKTKRQVGSVPWYTITVKLDLEARGRIERIPGLSPQMLRKTG